jgi:two-component system cell cycle sensor histidine kinase/response regulator CckA
LNLQNALLQVWQARCSDSLDSRGGMSRCIIRALRIALLAMVSAFAFEATRQSVFPKISIWGSHILTILFLTASTFVVSIVMLRREEKTSTVLELRLREITHLRLLIEHSRDGMCIIDQDFRVVETNKTQANMLGYTAEEMRQLCVWDWEAKFTTEQFSAAFPKLKSESPLFETQHRRKDGTLYDAEVSVSIADVGGQPMGFCVTRDITERKRFEIELRRLNRARSTLSECNGALVHATDEAQLLNQICEIVVQTGGYRLAWVGYAEHDKGKTVRLMAKSGLDDGYIEKAQITWADTERGRGPAGTAIRTGEACILRDILQNPQFSPWRDDAARRGYASIISLPLRNESQAIGALTIYAPEPDSFDDPEVELLKELADDLAYGIESLRNAAERRRTEAALRESERRYRRLFASNPHPMWVFDVETLAFLEVNDAAIAHYGYSREEFLKLTIKDIRPPEDIPGVLAALSNAECGYKLSGGTRHRKKDGTVIYVEIAAYRFVQHGKLVSLILANDVTERKRAEEAVHRSEAEMRSFVEKSPFGIFRTYIEKDRFLDVNPALVKMLGYASAEEVLSLTLSADVYFDTQERDKTLAPLLSDGGFSGIEAQCRRKDGKIITAHLSGRLVQESTTGDRFFEGIAEDVTERKRAEQALKESEKRFRQVVEGAPVGMYIQSDGLFRYFNPAALAMFGAESPEQIVGQGFLERIHPDSRAAVSERARLVREEKKAVPFLEERLLRLDSTVFDGEVTAIPFTFEERAGALVFVRDITGRKREEEKRHALEQQLRQAQKMEAVGRLAGGIAHDFNNLLMVIQSYAEMLQDSLPAHDVQRKNTREIMKAAERAGSLTGQMLAFSRKQITSPVVLDLNAVIDETAKMLKRLIGEDIEFRIDSAESLWTIEADSDQIVQVLMNLCVNGRDAMPQGGTLTIATGNVTIDEGSIAGRPYVSPGDYVMLSVTDTGMGIKKDLQEQIFDPFFTTKEVGKGTGLGLAMVYGIVKQSGGYVWVDSEPGQGACFTIYLPRVQAAIVPFMSAKAEARPRGTETILVAEDEEALREAICGFLRSLEYTVFAASTGHQALSIASQHEGHIDLLITDVVMPKMSGRELSQILESLRPNLKTIYMSGYTDDAVLRHGIQDVDAIFLQKPFGLDTLARKVRDMLERTETVQ